MGSLAWEPPLWKRKYMYTNSESIPYYFKYLEQSYLIVTFWPIMGENNFFIRHSKKLNWDLHEYITYKQVSIYLWGHWLSSVHTHIYILYIHTYIHTYINTYIHTYIHTYGCTYVSTYICMYIHTYYFILLVVLSIYSGHAYVLRQSNKVVKAKQ